MRQRRCARDWQRVDYADECISVLQIGCARKAVKNLKQTATCCIDSQKRPVADVTLQSFAPIVSVRAKGSCSVPAPLGANRFVGRSLHQTRDALGVLVMRLRNLGDGWLELRQQIQ